MKFYSFFFFCALTFAILFSGMIKRPQPHSAIPSGSEKSGADPWEVRKAQSHPASSSHAPDDYGSRVTEAPTNHVAPKNHVAPIKTVQLFIKNNCADIIWPATLTFGTFQLSNTGFELDSGLIAAIYVPANWTGRVWARTGCSIHDSGKLICSTGDCDSGRVACNGAGGSSPVSLAEFNLAAASDTYDISLVDGFNLPISVDVIIFEGTFPQGGSSDACSSISCNANVNDNCPPELAIGDAGVTFGCKSACMALNQPQYCCTGVFSTPQNCKATNYSMFFKNQCPQAHSYPYDDDGTSIFTCTPGLNNYLITFCP